MVNSHPQPRALAMPCIPQRTEPRGGGGLQDEGLVPHWAEGLVYDLGAMDLIFRDEVFDHSLHPLLVVGVGWLLAPGLDAQQAVWVTEPCEGGGLGIPLRSSSSPSSHGTPTPPLTTDIFTQNSLGFLHSGFQAVNGALEK